MTAEAKLAELTTVIVAHFVSNNVLKARDLPALISSTYAALAMVQTGHGPGDGQATPAVPVASSITHDYLICLNDGQKLKSLTRYLWRKYSLSPEAYRSMWSLPDDYPMVAPAYSDLRSGIARRKAVTKVSPADR